MSEPIKPATPVTVAQPAQSKQSVMLTLFIVICICIISVFAVHMATNRGSPVERADKEFLSQMQHSLSVGGWKGSVAASNGVCTVTLEDSVPAGIADSLARMSAGIYSQVRKKHSAEPEVFVEIYSRRIKVAEAASSTGEVDWRGELQNLVKEAREAEKQAVSGR